jgi:acetyltransferase-like isoleucine patch superfamily enzyme
MGIPTAMKGGILNVTFGENVTYVEPVNLYDCTIGDDCFIGPFVEIRKDVKIGSGTKIHSHSYICELVTIGQNCLVGHGVMFINDTFKNGSPADENPAKWEPTHIGDNVSIGSNATLLPVNICDNVVIGAGAIVTKDIEKPGVYGGNPARLHRLF